MSDVGAGWGGAEAGLAWCPPGERVLAHVERAGEATP